MSNQDSNSECADRGRGKGRGRRCQERRHRHRGDCAGRHDERGKRRHGRRRCCEREAATP
jgi:hypothetical protein